VGRDRRHSGSAIFSATGEIFNPSLKVFDMKAEKEFTKTIILIVMISFLLRAALGLEW
jgi:hypothetical protein